MRWRTFGTCLAVLAAGLEAREIYQPASGLIQRAASIAHVRVESSQPVAGIRGVYDFRVTRLESFKGRLPASFKVRLALLSRVVDRDGRPDPAGSEWIVILGKRVSRSGPYPIASLTYGKIEIAVTANGDRRLARRLNFLNGSRGRFYRLTEFREIVRTSQKGKRR